MVTDSTTNNKDKYFKGQQENEILICFFRHHWIDLLREFVYFSLFVFIISTLLTNTTTVKEIMVGNRELKLFFYTGYLMLTIYMHRFFLVVFNYFINVGIVTNNRIVDHQKTLFFKDTLDSIDLAQIQNIEKIENGVLPSILGYGDIKIFLTASDSIKTFSRIPNAKYHFRCLNRLRERRQNSFMQRNHGEVPQFKDQMVPTMSPQLKEPEEDQFSKPIQVIRSAPRE